MFRRKKQQDMNIAPHRRIRVICDIEDAKFQLDGGVWYEKVGDKWKECDEPSGSFTHMPLSQEAEESFLDQLSKQFQVKWSEQKEKIRDLLGVDPF